MRHPTGYTCIVCILVLSGLAGCVNQRPYELVRIIEVAGRQGVATDGERYFVSGSKALFTYSKQGELIRSNEEPFTGLDKPANHFGDISYYKGELYTGIEWFEDGRGRDIQIAVYDAKTLRFKRSFPWNPESGQVELSAIAVDEPNGLVWLTDWVNGNYLYKYRLSDGRYMGKLHLWPVPQWQQGIAEYKGYLYLTADDGNTDRQEADHLWRVPADPEASGAYIKRVMVFRQFRDLGEIEGLDFDESAKELIVHNNRGKRIVLGMPKGFYPGYDREISELYIFKIND